MVTFTVSVGFISGNRRTSLMSELWSAGIKRNNEEGDMPVESAIRRVALRLVDIQILLPMYKHE